ncbi:hypothetical protein BHM03_00061185 [Ensete ventricosum]|nr:hypothetical protein BHM03_00061185 [Ensete ventricosum]
MAVACAVASARLRAVGLWDTAIAVGARGRRLCGLCCTRWSLARAAAATAAVVNRLWQTCARPSLDAAAAYARPTQHLAWAAQLPLMRSSLVATVAWMWLLLAHGRQRVATAMHDYYLHDQPSTRLGQLPVWLLRLPAVAVCTCCPVQPLAQADPL